MMVTDIQCHYCFLFIIRGKRKSQASSDRHNRKRSLSSIEPTARHITGMQPDMKCLYLNYEIGFTEVGLKDDGENGTKELYESGMKAPKMLKDFFLSIIRERPSIIHSIKTGAFIISGMCFTPNAEHGIYVPIMN